MFERRLTSRKKKLEHLNQSEISNLSHNFVDFLDVISSATDKSTYYETYQEIQSKIDLAHNSIFSIDRGIYSLGLVLPGVNDYNRRLGIFKLLSNPKQSKSALLTKDQETEVILWLLQNIEPQRMLKTFNDLADNKVNNSRTRKSILRMILRNSKLSFWATKYRRSIKIALQHAWGIRRSSIISNILSKYDCDEPDKRNWDPKEWNIIRNLVYKYIKHMENIDRKNVYESICFIFGKKMSYENRYFKAFENAKTNLEDGAILHWTVLEGIRSTYHQNVPHSIVLELTSSKSSSEGDKMRMQKRAKEANIEVDFDPEKIDQVKLYIYSFEMGLSDRIDNELSKKAKQYASNLPLNFNDCTIIIDASQSMYGSKESNLKPISIGLSISDILKESSKNYNIEISGGKQLNHRLIKPEGETKLAYNVINAMKNKPEVIFIISDGYENSPAGRTIEVVNGLRKLGYRTPIYHINPVPSSLGVKKISDHIPTIPVSSPDSLGLGVIRGCFELEPELAISGLIKLTFPKIGLEESKQ